MILRSRLLTRCSRTLLRWIPCPRGILAAISLAQLSCGGEPAALDVPPMQIERVHAALVLDADAREVLQEHPAHPVVQETLRPFRKGDVGLAALPCLRMVPPAQIRIVLPDYPAGARLHLAFGCDALAFAESHAEGRIAFTVESGGETLVEEIKRYGPNVPRRQRAWHETQLELTGQRELILRTRLLKGSSGQPLAGMGLLEITSHEPRARHAPSPDRPNVIFILVDTLRADRLAPYGYKAELTPHISSFAEQGTLFEQASAPSSWTWPSTASLMTGVSPPEHGVLSNTACFLAHEFLTLAEAFQENGVSTGAFSANPLVRAELDFDQGFEHFVGYRWAHATRMIDDAVDWMDSLGGARFYLYLHWTDPHEYKPLPPYAAAWVGEAPEAFEDAGWVALNHAMRRGGADYDSARHIRWAEHMSALYDATIAETDAALGRLLQLLEERGWSEETIVLLSSDHGEEFFDHGLLGHGRQLYSSTVHVPLIMRGPGVEAGRRIATPVENRFIAPTLLRLAGIEPEENLALPDLLQLAQRKALPQFFTTVKGRRRAPEVRGGVREVGDLHAMSHAGYLYLWAPQPPDGEPVRALYHIAVDPRALDEVSESEPELAQKMERAIAAWLAAGASKRPQVMGGGAATIELLQGMGYLDGGEDE